MKALILIMVVLVALSISATVKADAITFDAGGVGPKAIVLSLDNQYLYVACGEGIVTKVRLSDRVVTDSVVVGFGAIDLAMTPDGQYLYVTNTVDGYYTSKIELTTFEVDTTISGGTDPAGLCLTPDGATVCITSHWSPFLQLISVETDSEIVRIPGISNGSYDVVVTPDGNYAYVVARSTGPDPGSGIFKISLADFTIINTIPFVGGEEIAITPSGDEVWVPGNIFSDHVYILSTEDDSIVDSVAVGLRPINVEISPNGMYAYVANHDDNSVTEISVQGKTVIRTIETGTGPYGIAFSANGSRIFVANTQDNTITEIYQDFWCDDFENYPPGSSIGGLNWILSGNISSTVDSNVSYEGNQSVRMYGLVGECWGAVANRLLETDFPMTIDFAVRNGTEALSGCHPYRASMSLYTGPEWPYPVSMGLFHFSDNGDLIIESSESEDTLFGFSLEQWYKFWIEVWIDTTDGYVHTRYWIDENFRGEYTQDTTTLPQLQEAEYLEICAQEGTVWFDDICVSRGLLDSCVYVAGDINGNGTANGIDVTYGVSYLKGGNAPPDSCDCPPLAFPFYGAMDVNGNCAANGIDITYFVSYLKGQQPALLFCQDCPPAGPAAPPAPAVMPIKSPALKSHGILRSGE